MKFQDLHHDEAVLTELGRRLAQHRIDLNMTQAELAGKAGVGKRTLERLEAGELDLFAKLEILLPEPKARPRHASREGGRLPQRAAKKRSKPGRADDWKWGDET